MTRGEMIQAILAVDDEEFQSEIRYHCHDIEREDDDEIPYDEVAALFDIEDRAEDPQDGDRRLLKLCRQALIEIGFYRVMPQEEIDSTTRSGGGPVWCFRLNKLAYTTDHNAEAWQFPSEA